jgi:hypothetical protein
MLNYLSALLFRRSVGGRNGGGTSRKPRASQKRLSYCPALESLEDRTVPSTMGSDRNAALLDNTGGAAQWQQQLTTLIQTESQLANLASHAQGGSQQAIHGHPARS